MLCLELLLLCSEDPQLYATWEKLKIELQRLLAIYNRILISLESAAGILYVYHVSLYAYIQRFNNFVK